MVYNLTMTHGSLENPAIMAIPRMYQQLDFLSLPLLLYTISTLEIDISATKEKGKLYRQIFSEVERPHTSVRPWMRRITKTGSRLANICPNRGDRNEKERGSIP